MNDHFIAYYLSDPSRDRVFFEKGCELYNKGDYFEAHEVWEMIWKKTEHPQKELLQGLIQLSVVFYQISEKRLVGAEKNLKKTLKRFREIKTKEPAFETFYQELEQMLYLIQAEKIDEIRQIKLPI